MNRRTVLGTLGGVAAALASPWPRRARAAEVSLRLHHFLTAASNGHKNLLVPWAKKIEEQSEGRIRIEIYPSMSLGGVPAQLFDQARKGVAHIVWTLPGNTPNRFPRIEVFELPFVPAKLGVTSAKAVQEYADRHLGEEVGEVHLLSAWAHDRGVIHCRRLVKTQEDLWGLKLRFPTRMSGKALKALGAGAIGMPTPQVPASLAQGVIDGAVIPWEVVPALKIQDFAPYHTEMPGTPTFYTTTFFLAMNKPAYEGLPPDLRAIFDANSGMAFATAAGTMWDKAALPAIELAKKADNVIYTLTEDEAMRWRQATQPIVDGWVTRMKERGLDGEALLEEARALIAKHAQVASL
ncbi:MAG TPA: TRAP transporter substrate-binding protein [Geminicoccaceae bacterium]|nr:TRAP transporter substrate-binding protein [Geminicoccaceae bacterium]